MKIILLFILFFPVICNADEVGMSEKDKYQNVDPIKECIEAEQYNECAVKVEEINRFWTDSHEQNTKDRCNNSDEQSECYADFLKNDEPKGLDI